MKERIPTCKIIGVDPVLSLMAPNSKPMTAVSEIEGVGYDFVPTNLDRGVIDHWVKVDDRDGFNMCREMIRKEGLLVGGSSGALMFGALQGIKELGFTEKHRIVVIVPDGVRNYMTKFLSDKWMKEKKFL
jgi:cystathionine beta-synthase